MLRKAKDLNGYKLDARDGTIGKVKEFYFDDHSWTVRYLVADTAGWLTGRAVLISPYSLEPANEGGKVIPVDLTKTQIEKSPSLNTDRPVSRQYEWEYFSFYGLPAYWDGPYTWGPGAYPAREQNQWSDASRSDRTEDPRLRSTKAVTGCRIQAQDGEIGHVGDFVIDDETWTIRYLIVDTQNWWPGKKVLIPTQWIERISWEESKVFIHMTREAVRQSPEYTDQTLITRDHEIQLHRHYNREGYWADKPGKSTQ
jgi:hypothetical protein